MLLITISLKSICLLLIENFSLINDLLSGLAINLRHNQKQLKKIYGSNLQISTMVAWQVYD